MIGAGNFLRTARSLAAVIVLSVGLALPAAAQVGGVSNMPGQMPGQTQVAEKDRIACVARGGKIKPVCRSGRLMCVAAYKDAGKACTDNSQCVSNKCVAEPAAGPIGSETEGKCKVTNDPCGCTTLVKNGKRTSTLCVD